jgi:hypothetical protein
MPKTTFDVTVTVNDSALRNLINQGYLDARVDGEQCLIVNENMQKLNRLISEIVNRRWGEG